MKRLERVWYWDSVRGVGVGGDWWDEAEEEEEEEVVAVLGSREGGGCGSEVSGWRPLRGVGVVVRVR